MRRSRALVILLILVLVAFALRAFRLDFQSLWYDEAFSVYLAQFSLAEITARTASDIQPPLYYYLLHVWIALAGEREFAVRFLSLSFGLLTIPLLFVTARRLFNLPAAILAALLATLSPLYLWYSQEARMYTLITFLLLLSGYAMLRGMRVQTSEVYQTSEVSSTRWWIVYALANIAAVYTHYFAFAVIGFQLLYGVVSVFRARGPSANLKPLLLSFAAVCLAFLPWLPFVLARLNEDASYWRGALKLDEAVRHIFINFTMGESVLEAQAQWIAAGWLLVLVVGLIGWVVLDSNLRSAKGSSFRSILFVVLYLIVPLALLLFLFYRNPKFNARYLMMVSPAFFLLLGVGLASGWEWVTRNSQRGRRILSAVAGLVLLLAFCFLLFTSAYADANAFFDPAFTKASFREVARYVQDHLAPGEAIILASGHLFPAFDYYYRGDAPQIRLPDDPTLNANHVLGYAAANVLNETLAGARGAWVVLWQDEVVDPNGFLPMLLSTRGQEQKIGETSFYQVRLRHWSLVPGAPFPAEPQPVIARPANFKDKVELLGLSPNPTPADQGASFNLYWHVLDDLPDDYQVALRVSDAAGNLWGKQDRRPAGYNYPTSRWKKGEDLFGAYTVPLLAGAPAGDYFVQVTLYTAGDPPGLDVLAPNGAPTGKTVRLGPVPVLPATKPATYAALNIQNSISQPLGPLTLLGYQLGRDKASAGESVPLTLFWRADRKPDKDYRFRLRFDSSPTEFFPLANAQFPTSRWNAGEIVRGQYLVQIPSDVTAGTKEIHLDLDSGAGQDLVLASFTVEKTDRVFVQPNVQNAQAATFGSNDLALVGYDADTTLRPGGTMKLNLYWQARGKMDKPYTVFVHLLDKDSKVIAQKDAQPANGARPTNGWVPGEYIQDAYELMLKPDVAPGEYRVEIGWYDATDSSRLPVLDDSGAPAADHVILKSSWIVR